ncbi:DUF1254 domain-containing protein [Streptomyces flavochromogenes]|uniref:DUF1254 domain-containing protein n=1 Tax=Streptomyces flavochromogenes TaxID=68199 RepID=A0ABW6XTG9_9ACTN|nr:DUF1254 domain-containing protein [Streptomyces flavochromogenes]
MPHRTDNLADLAADAYVYGYPLVFDASMISAFMHKGFGSLPPTPFNRFGHSTKLATPDAHFVSVNNDTVYSIAQVDLSGGPVLLHVPDTAGAYYVLQFVDVWSSNFAYLGQRATGTEEGDWLITPPGWSGTAPDGVRGVIDAPTAVISIVGRNACDGPEDMPRVQALQQQLTLTPLDKTAHRTGLPTPDPDAPEELRFYEQLRVWMADFPPAGPDQDHQERFQPLGLLEEGPSPYVNAEPALVKALTEGLATGKARVEAAANPPAEGERPPGAWVMNPHLFDYNLDHFGVGTLDTPQWRIADREASYLVRAGAARSALWGNHGYEAVYAHTFTDADGEQLNGSRSYTLRFEEQPPVESFWSVTMYDTPDYYLVENPVGRYSLGDRTPGLVYGEDGSLTVVIQRERPEDPAEAANWLPAPAGDFRPMIRLYTPGPSVLDGTYRLPPITARK